MKKKKGLVSTNTKVSRKTLKTVKKKAVKKVVKKATSTKRVTNKKKNGLQMIILT